MYHLTNTFTSKIKITNDIPITIEVKITFSFIDIFTYG